jgi:hypothetical protein
MSSAMRFKAGVKGKETKRETGLYHQGVETYIPFQFGLSPTQEHALALYGGISPSLCCKMMGIPTQT